MTRLNSRRRIQRALFELLKERSIDKITVSEVVEKAGVSRTSYYRAYGSLQSVVDEALDELFAKIESIAPYATDTPEESEDKEFERAISGVLMLYQDRVEQLKMLLEGSADKTFRNRLFTFTLESLPVSDDGQDSMTPEAMRRAYMAAGTTVVVCRWVAEGCRIPIPVMTDFIMEKRKEALGE